MPKYVVLRRTDTGMGVGQADSSDRFGPQDPVESLSITTEEIARSNESQLKLDREVLGFAPVMPTRLIMPFNGTPDAAGEEIWGLEAIGADRTDLNGDGVTMAVLDTGIDRDHPAFNGMELIERDFSGCGDGDAEGHGTHCAGTIFGRDIEGRRIGVAPGVQRALIGKVLGDDGAGDTKMVLDAMNWALEEGANVISLSLGFDFPGMVKSLTEDEGWPADLATSLALESFRANLDLFNTTIAAMQARKALGKHAILIAAAGNESRRDESADYRISASLPAAADGILSVAAVGRQEHKFHIADFSNSSPTISAPGLDIVSAALGGGLKSLSGTSMACPHAAGAAALWWQFIREAGGTPTAANVTAKLVGTTTRDRLHDYNVTDFGEGLVNVPTKAQS